MDSMKARAIVQEEIERLEAQEIREECARISSGIVGTKGKVDALDAYKASL